MRAVITKGLEYIKVFLTPKKKNSIFFTFHHLFPCRFNFHNLFKAVSGLKKRQILIIIGYMICFTSKPLEINMILVTPKYYSISAQEWHIENYDALYNTCINKEFNQISMLNISLFSS